MERISSVIDIDIDKITFPKLVRCRPVKLSVERKQRASGAQLESKIDENISLSLEEAITEGDLPAEVPELRIIVNIKLAAIWREKATKNEVISFAADYEGLFHFRKGVTPDRIENFVNSKVYRDILIAQCYPVARAHMTSVLQSMGVNHKRDLGFDLHESSNIQSED